MGLDAYNCAVHNQHALNAISLASANFGGIINIAISGIVLYYLYRPHVKAYFGKVPATTT